MIRRLPATLCITIFPLTRWPFSQRSRHADSSAPPFNVLLLETDVLAGTHSSGDGDSKQRPVPGRPLMLSKIPELGKLRDRGSANSRLQRLPRRKGIFSTKQAARCLGGFSLHHFDVALRNCRNQGGFTHRDTMTRCVIPVTALWCE